MNPLARRQLAGLVLAFATLHAASRFRFSGKPAQLFHEIVMFLCRSCRRLISQAVLLELVSSERKCGPRDAWPSTPFPAIRPLPAPFLRKLPKRAATAMQSMLPARWLPPE